MSDTPKMIDAESTEMGKPKPKNPVHAAIEALARVSEKLELLNARMTNLEEFTKQAILASRNGVESYVAFMAEKSGVATSIITNADEATADARRVEAELEDKTEENADKVG
jgi:hypothetical protein